MSSENISPCSAELLFSIFHSFEAGIANAISSFKWQKNMITVFMKNSHLQNWIIWITQHLSQAALSFLGEILSSFI